MAVTPSHAPDCPEEKVPVARVVPRGMANLTLRKQVEMTNRIGRILGSLSRVLRLVRPYPVVHARRKDVPRVELLCPPHGMVVVR